MELKRDLPKSDAELLPKIEPEPKGEAEVVPKIDCLAFWMSTVPSFVYASVRPVLAGIFENRLEKSPDPADEDPNRLLPKILNRCLFTSKLVLWILLTLVYSLLLDCLVDLECSM